MPQSTWLLPGKSFQKFISLRHSEAFAAVTQEGQATSSPGGRPWHHTHGAGISGMMNASAVGQRLPTMFQRKTWRARQSLPEKLICKDVRIKTAGTVDPPGIPLTECN